MHSKAAVHKCRHNYSYMEDLSTSEVNHHQNCKEHSPQKSPHNLHMVVLVASPDNLVTISSLQNPRRIRLHQQSHSPQPTELIVVETARYEIINKLIVTLIVVVCRIIHHIYLRHYRMPSKVPHLLRTFLLRRGSCYSLCRNLLQLSRSSI